MLCNFLCCYGQACALRRKVKLCLRSFFAAALWCRWSEKNDVHGGLLYNYSYS